jgi:hypothetical protein
MMGVEACLTSPRVREEVVAQRWVRGLTAHSVFVEAAPHPDPLRVSFARLDPASGAREKSAASADASYHA